MYIYKLSDCHKNSITFQFNNPHGFISAWNNNWMLTKIGVMFYFGQTSKWTHLYFQSEVWSMFVLLQMSDQKQFSFGTMS